MALNERLELLITANGSAAVREFGKVGDAADKELKKTQGSLDKTANTMTSVGTKAIGVGVILTAAFVGAAKAADESQIATAKMLNTIDNAPQLAGESVDQFQDLATALQKSTVATDEQVLSAEAMLGQFGLTAAEIKGLTPLVVDLSRKMGIDMESAAKMVGKAMDGSSGALKKAGIVIDVMRTGAGLNTQVSFAPYRDPSTDTVVFAPITEQMAAAYRQGCVQDLDDPSPAVELTPSQIDEVVKMTEVQDNKGLAAAFKEARKPKREPDARGASQIQVLGQRPADDTAAMNAAMDKVMAVQAAAGAAQAQDAKVLSVAAPATTNASIAGNLRETVPAASTPGPAAAPIDMAALKAKLGLMLKPKAD